MLTQEHSLVFVDGCVSLVTDTFIGDRHVGTRRTPLGEIEGVDLDDLPESVREEFLNELDLWRDAASWEWECRDAYADSRGRL